MKGRKEKVKDYLTFCSVSPGQLGVETPALALWLCTIKTKIITNRGFCILFCN